MPASSAESSEIVRALREEDPQIHDDAAEPTGLHRGLLFGRAPEVIEEGNQDREHRGEMVRRVDH